jgi:hypothetical protein
MTDPVPDPSLWATNPAQDQAEDAAIDAQTLADAAVTPTVLAIGTAENVAADVLPVAAAAAAIADPALAPVAAGLEPVAAALLRAQPDAVAATQNAAAKTAETVVTGIVTAAIVPAPKEKP